MDAGAGGRACHDGLELKDLHCRMLELRAVPVGSRGKGRGMEEDGSSGTRKRELCV